MWDGNRQQEGQEGLRSLCPKLILFNPFPWSHQYFLLRIHISNEECTWEMGQVQEERED